MVKNIDVLKHLGLDEREIQVYLALVETGSASIRNLAHRTKINRGTVYETVKSLVSKGLASHFRGEGTKKFFAEPPAKLREVVDREAKKFDDLRAALDRLIPELEAVYDIGSSRPVVHYYEGDHGVKVLLSDVLDTAGGLEKKEYVVYSAHGIREYLYRAFKNFTAERVKRNIKVRAIALGKGGEKARLAERRWLTKEVKGSPTYMIIYGGKLGLISVDNNQNQLVVVVKDLALAETQRLIFEALWQKLE